MQHSLVGNTLLALQGLPVLYSPPTSIANRLETHIFHLDMKFSKTKTDFTTHVNFPKINRTTPPATHTLKQCVFRQLQPRVDRVKFLQHQKFSQAVLLHPGTQQRKGRHQHSSSRSLSVSDLHSHQPILATVTYIGSVLHLVCSFNSPEERFLKSAQAWYQINSIYISQCEAQPLVFFQSHYGDVNLQPD